MRIYNSVLNPDIWSDENRIKPDIRIKLLQIGQDFYKNANLTVPISDILLIGSNANFNWTPTSDLDVHIVIDFKKLEMSNESAKEFTNLLKFRWNLEHDIHIKSYNVEVYIQDVSSKNSATGVYSLLNDKWLMKPVQQNIVLDKELIKSKYQDSVKKIKTAIQEQNLERMKTILKDFYDFRQAGLDRAGEFSTENVVFKLLRNKGHLDALRDATNKLYDKQTSIN
jgi:predicted nucleotidyltransferase